MAMSDGIRSGREAYKTNRDACGVFPDEFWDSVARCFYTAACKRVAAEDGEYSKMQPLEGRSLPEYLEGQWQRPSG